MTMDLTTFKQYLYIEKKHDRSRTAQTDSICKRFSKYFKDRAFNKTNVNFFISSLIDKKLAYGTINNYIAICKNYAQFINSHELDNYKYYPQPHKLIDKLTTDEIKKLINVRIQYAKRKNYLNIMYPLLITLLAVTGMRINEVLVLTTNDLANNCVFIRDSKTDKSRVVPISPNLFKKLLAFASNGLIFKSYRNKGLFASGVRHDLRLRAKKCKVKKPVYPHVFRHSFITELLEQGVNINDVADIVGHADIQTTREYNAQTVGHLRAVITHHPLIAQGLTFEEIIDKISQFSKSLLNKTKFNYNIAISDSDFIIRINKN